MVHHEGMTYQHRLLRNPYALEAIRIGHKRRWPLAQIHQYAFLLWFIANA